MAVQIVTPQNFQEFVQTGKVPEFKPPEAVKPAEPAKEPAKAEAKPSEEQKQPRDDGGRFTTPKNDDKTQASAATADDEGGDNLPEHARKVIGKKHRAMKEAEEFARDQWRKREAAETRAEKLQRELEDTKSKSRPAAEPAKEPKPEDFKTVAEYTDALVEFRVARKFEAEREKAEQQRQADEKAAREREFGKRLAAAKEKHDDWNEVMSSLSGSELDKVHSDVVEYLQESEHGADLIYHLAKHSETLERLRKLSPRRFIAELGKLEAQWEKSPEPAETKLSEAVATTTTAAPAVSKAPAPIAALDAAKSTVVHKDPSTMTFKELREFERQRDAEKRARR